MDTAFFILSKLVGAGLRVETWLVLMAIAALVAATRGNLQGARRWSALMVLGMLLVGFVPLGDRLLRPIEHLYPPIEDTGDIDGIIVLGGGEDVPASLLAGQPQVGEGGDRYLAALALARTAPGALILFAGGSGRLRDVTGGHVSEAAIAERIFLSHGIGPERLLVESRSRNTAENARLARELADPSEAARWVLVTSAFHMPRAVASFERAGWDGILPYPVDYRTRGWRDGLGWNFERNLGLLNTAILEWVGRAAYALTGR
ncbi:YdcF family protein [Rhodobacterales bacterium HKCCSP123]|nr:YdcF family protein [Rhodobacterales bacterium HKCCSP123]